MNYKHVSSVFGGKLALGVWAFSFSIFFLSSLVQREMSADTKIWLVTREVTASGILQVSNKSFVAFLLNNSAHRSDIVWSKETLCIFFLFLFLFLFPPIFDWLILFSLFFSFLLLSSNLWLVDFLFSFLFSFW